MLLFFVGIDVLFRYFVSGAVGGQCLWLTLVECLNKNQPTYFAKQLI